MSFVLVAPDVLATAAADATQIGSAVTAGNLAAAIPTTELAAAAGDEVSAAIAALFGAHAQQYQAAAAQAATSYEQFVRTLSEAAASYAGAEATSAASLAGLESLVANEIQAFVAAPIQTIGQAWNNSPLGQAINPIINPPTGGNGQSIVIDFVRHGQSLSNVANVIDTGVPGAPLSTLRQQQAVAVRT